MKQKSYLSIVLMDVKALIKCLIGSDTTTVLMFCIRPKTCSDIRQIADLGMFI